MYLIIWSLQHLYKRRCSKLFYNCNKMKLLLLAIAALCATTYGNITNWIYKEIIFFTKFISATPTPGFFPGFQNGLERIVGGEGAARNQFPYQLTLQWGILGIFQHVCGASVIAPSRAVTAAHCITETPNIGSLRIRGGIHLLNDIVASIQTIAVQSSIVHPEYAG